MEYFISWKGKFSLDLHLLISPVVISSAFLLYTFLLYYIIIFLFREVFPFIALGHLIVVDGKKHIW